MESQVATSLDIKLGNTNQLNMLPPNIKMHIASQAKERS